MLGILSASLLWLAAASNGCETCETSALLQHRSQCNDRCRDPIPSQLFSANDGPQPYALYQAGASADTRRLSMVYQRLQLQGVRPDEAGLAFDLRCMFPVASLEDLPDPEDDANWDWSYSDSFFKAMVDAGLAPFLKLGVNTWTSERLSGWSYVDWASGNVTYVIPPQMYDTCKPWPAISPVIKAIGPQLVLKIVQRYNANGSLEAHNWPHGYAAVELMNEWNTLMCRPQGFPCDTNTPNATDWADHCYGPPWTWGSRYWDGTPQMAVDFYVQTAKLIKASYPRIRVGGPASGTSGSFFPCGDMSQTSIGMSWIHLFLEKVKMEGGSSILDFFSWHYYGSGQGQTSMATSPDVHSEEFVSLANITQSYQEALDSHGLGSIPFVVSEFNAGFVLGNRSAYVGSMAGASTNLAKYAFFASHRFAAAFIYQGLSGAFEALNPYSFPLSCSANYEELNCSTCSEISLLEAPPVPDLRMPHRQPRCGCTPQDLLWQMANGSYGPMGTFDQSCSCPLNALDGCTGCDNDHCQFGPNPRSGMGSVYANSMLTPMGVLLLMLRSAHGAPRLELLPEGMAKLMEQGVYALAWQAGRGRRATLVLSNPWSSEAQLPSAAALLPCTDVVRAWRLQQKSRGQYVDSLTGVNSTLPLRGQRRRAKDLEGNAREVLGPLQPFETMELDLAYTGCDCHRHHYYTQ